MPVSEKTLNDLFLEMRKDLYSAEKQILGCAWEDEQDAGLRKACARL
jgi:ferritin-like metal-binding protein YciE